MTHPYDLPDKWDGYRKLDGPMTDEQKARIVELRALVVPAIQSMVDVLFERVTFDGAVTREGTLNAASAQALIHILEEEVKLCSPKEM